MEFIKNIKTSKFGQIFQYSIIKYLALGFGFLKGIVNAKFLGPELLGVLGNLTLILGYCSYANLGIVHSMNREYVLAKEESDAKANSVINTTFTSLIILSLIFIILSIGSIIFYKNDYGVYIALIFIIAIFEQFKNYFVNYFRLINNYNMINLVEVIYSIIAFILTVFLINNFKVYGALIAMLTCGIAIFIVAIFKTKNIIIKIDKIILKDLISVGIPLLIYNLGFYILTTIDRWIIIRFFTEVDLGYYTFANSMVSATLVFVSSMLFLLYPKLIKDFNEGKNINISEKIKGYTKLLEIASVIFFTIGVILFKPFILTFLNRYTGSIEIYMILLMAIIMNNLAYFSNAYIVSNKKQRYLVYLQILAVAVNIACNMSFLKLGLGVKGVALSTLIANAIYSFFQYSIFFKLNTNKFEIIKSIIIYSKIIIYNVFVTVMILLNINYIYCVIVTIILSLILYFNELKNIKEYIKLLKKN